MAFPRSDRISARLFCRTYSRRARSMRSFFVLTPANLKASLTSLSLRTIFVRMIYTSRVYGLYHISTWPRQIIPFKDRFSLCHGWIYSYREEGIFVIPGLSDQDYAGSQQT